MARRYRVEIDAAAERDLLEMQAYIAADAPGRAAEFTERLLGRLYSLEQFPERHSLAPESAHSSEPVRSMPFPPYRILYSIRGDTVHVNRVLHGARRPIDPPTK